MRNIPRNHPSHGYSTKIRGRRNRVLNILIVEDDSQLAVTLKYLVEDNPRYQVVATANDLESAVTAAEEHLPDLALVDLRLAHGTTGFSVAVRMGDFDIPCFFITGKAPDFPMPDLALGCLMKPFTAEEVHRALNLAEDKLRGRESVRPRIPQNLQMYEAPAASDIPETGFIPSRPSLRTRIEHWIAGQHH